MRNCSGVARVSAVEVTTDDDCTIVAMTSARVVRGIRLQPDFRSLQLPPRPGSQDFFTKAANWPRGAALSIVMLAVTLVLVGIAARIVNVRRLVG